MSNTPLRLRVLVVDDEPLIRWAVAEALSAGGTAAVVDAVRAFGACCALTKPVDVETIGNVVLAAHHERRGGTRWPMPLDAEVVHAQSVDPSTT